VLRPCWGGGTSLICCGSIEAVSGKGEVFSEQCEGSVYEKRLGEEGRELCALESGRLFGWRNARGEKGNKWKCL